MSNSNFPKLQKPPLTEAIFEVLFTLEEGFNVNSFDSFYSEFSSEFTKKEDITNFEAKIDSKSNETNSIKSEKIGYLFLNESKSKAMHVRTNGFVFSMTNNSYKDWEPFRNEAWSAFCLLKKMFNITNINRSSLRFVNSISLPTNITDIKDYILIAPEMPKNLPFGLNKLFMQLTFPNESIGATGIVTQAFDIGFSVGDTFEYILDIDVQKINENGIDDEKNISDFENLRTFKNQIFFKSISEKTINLIEK